MRRDAQEVNLLDKTGTIVSGLTHAPDNYWSESDGLGRKIAVVKQRGHRMGGPAYRFHSKVFTALLSGLDVPIVAGYQDRGP